MFKVNHKLLPPHLMKTFHQNYEIHHHCIRSSKNYHLESISTNIKKKFSSRYKGPISWNSVPASIQLLNNIKQFKRNIIHSLTEKILILDYMGSPFHAELMLLGYYTCHTIISWFIYLLFCL